MQRPLRLLATVAALLLAASGHARDRNFQVYLCLGQSNMEGFPGIPEEAKAWSDPRFQVLAAVDFPELGREMGRWYTAVPPLCRPNSGVSPADYFGRAMVAQLPPDIRVGVINVSVAGARIEVFDKAGFQTYVAHGPDWLKGIVARYDGNPYRRLVDMAKLAQKTGVIRGILLHQGESNVNDREWPAKVKAVYENLLADLDLKAADVPLLAGGVVAADQQGKAAGMNDLISTLPALIPTAHFVSSAGAEGRSDHLHFTPEGYRELGKRYAGTMLSLLGSRPAESK
jgi:alpha-L-fucosidase 2